MKGEWRVVRCFFTSPSLNHPNTHPITHPIPSTHSLPPDTLTGGVEEGIVTAGKTWLVRIVIYFLLLEFCGNLSGEGERVGEGRDDVGGGCFLSTP